MDNTQTSSFFGNLNQVLQQGTDAAVKIAEAARIYRGQSPTLAPAPAPPSMGGFTSTQWTALVVVLGLGALIVYLVIKEK